MKKIATTQHQAVKMGRSYARSIRDPSDFDGFANFRKTSEVRHELRLINLFEKQTSKAIF